MSILNPFKRKQKPSIESILNQQQQLISIIDQQQQKVLAGIVN